MGQAPAPMLADYAAHIARDIVFVAEDRVAGAHMDDIKRDDLGIVGFAIIVKKGDDYWLENVAVTPMASGRGWAGKYWILSKTICARFVIVISFIRMLRWNGILAGITRLALPRPFAERLTAIIGSISRRSFENEHYWHLSLWRGAIHHSV